MYDEGFAETSPAHCLYYPWAVGLPTLTAHQWAAAQRLKIAALNDDRNRKNQSVGQLNAGERNTIPLCRSVEKPQAFVLTFCVAAMETSVNMQTVSQPGSPSASMTSARHRRQVNVRTPQPKAPG